MTAHIPPGAPSAPPFVPAYYTPTAHPRPAPVTVLAIVGIVLAGLGIIRNGVAAAGALAGWSFRSAADPAGRLYLAWGAANALANFALAAVLMCVAVGALGLRRWARRGMVYYACADLLWLAVGAVVLAGWVYPSIMQAAAAGAGGDTPHLEGLAFLFEMFGLAVASLYPLCALVVMTRPRVCAAFEAATGADGTRARPAPAPPAPLAPAYHQPGPSPQ